MPPGREKVGVKRPHGPQLSEPPLHPYEQLRLRQCMRNNSRLQQLGIPALSSMLASTNSISQRNRPSHRNSEDSESDYDISQDETGDDNVKGSKECNIRTTDNSLGAIKLCSKRVFAQQETTRITRSKKNIAQPDATLTPRHNIDYHTQGIVEANGHAHLDENTNMTNEGHVAPFDGKNPTGNEDNVDVLADNNRTIGGQVDDTNQMSNRDLELGQNDRWERGINMGHGLHRINRGLRGKLQVVIPEGKIRPMAPLVAAKFATECNISVRNHVPVFKHWKDYKNHSGLFNLFTGKLSAKFDINTSDAPVQKACSQMMKSAVRQQRYRLKKKYFDPFPLHLVAKKSPIRSMTDEEWNELVEYWKSPKKWRHLKKTKRIDPKLNSIKQLALVATWFM